MIKETFETYYIRHYEQVYKYILKKISDSHLAEDLAMDSFVACYKNFDSFDPAKASFATWLFVVVNNKIKNYYRDHKQHENVDDSDEYTEGLEDEIVEAEYLSMMRDELANALQQLSEIQRELVIKKYYKEMNSKEIALEMGMTPVNVRVQLSRSLEKMKKYFEKNNIRWEM